MTSLPSTSIYTPLESLLLFQALRIGPAVDSTTFARISDELKTVPLVKQDPSYDAARLSPDALRQLYLDLLKDESKRHLDRQLNGDISPTSRKRKAPSPKLPSVQEAVQHSHLIPQLITRLYIRYREITVAQIREQERRYDDAVRNLDEIKAGRQVEKLSASAQTSPKMSVASLIQSENQAPNQTTTKRHSQARIDAVINHGPNNDQTAHRRTPSGTVLPPLSDMAPHSPHYNVPSKVHSQHAYQPAPPTYAAQQHGHHIGSPQMHNSTNRPPASLLPPPAALAASPSVRSSGLSTPTVQSPQAYHSQARGSAQQQHSQAYGRPYQLAQPPHLPTPQGYYQQQYPDRRTSYPNQQQPQQQPQTQQGYGTYQNPPYQQVAPHQQYPVQYQPQYVPNSPATGPRPQPAQRVVMSDVLRALTTPPRQLRPPVWKSEKRSQSGEAPGSPTRPNVEPLSPVLARAPSPMRRAQSIRTRKAKRESSIVSDHGDSLRNTRSVSVVSTSKSADENVSKRRIKNETTPFIADSEEPEQAIPSMTTRKRRGTLTQPPSKRRKHSVEDADDEPPPRSTTVLVTRNFARMSTVIMQEIISHKHGSRFAQAVRDKDADGYSTFIKVPQDLKSIRAAVTNGSRAITAATTIEAPSTPGGTKLQDSVVELDRSIDLIPPKAIVNGAQLEREIMRMFANAVMFNPGEDGMVSDTREMFEDVEAKIAEWRGAERDLNPVAPAEEEDEGRVKRRKL